MLSNKVIFEDGKTKGLGYLKGLNSHKDYNEKTEEVQPMMKQLGILTKKEDVQKPRKAEVQSKLSLQNEQSPVRDQQMLGSCTAYAATGMVEYMQKKTRGKYQESSTMFVYKITRNLMDVTGDTGAWMRSVMGAIALVGVPPESKYPYDGREDRYNPTFDKEPGQFVYSIAQNYQSLRYLRLDSPDTTGQQLVDKMKLYLQKKLTIMIGFTCFDSLRQSNQADVKGLIPFPSTNESIIGGHAVLITGYDDNMSITNKQYNITTKGAFQFKNSWGTDWGQNGYGWIPYDYFKYRLADDCWTLLAQEFVDSIQFDE